MKKTIILASMMAFIITGVFTTTALAQEKQKSEKETQKPAMNAPRPDKDGTKPITSTPKPGMNTQRPPMNKPTPVAPAAERAKEVTDEINAAVELSKEQYAKLLALNTEMFSRRDSLKVMQDELNAKRQALSKDEQTKTREILTPEQLKKWMTARREQHKPNPGGNPNPNPMPNADPKGNPGVKDK